MRWNIDEENFIPTDVAFIDRLLLEPGSEGRLASLRLDVRLQHRQKGLPWPSWDRPMRTATLRLEGVSNLSLGPIGQMPLQITGFDIIDNTKSGLEFGRFEVLDYEAGLLSCACQRITVEESQSSGLADR